MKRRLERLLLRCRKKLLERGLVFVWICVGLSACTYSMKPSTVDDINRLTLGKRAEIVLRNEEVLQGEDVMVGADSTFWFDKAAKERRFISTSEVRRIVVPNSGRGAKDGVLLGALLGGTVGLAIALSNSEQESSLDFSGYDKALYVPAGFFGGGIAGALIGSINAKDKIEIDENLKD